MSVIYLLPCPFCEGDAIFDTVEEESRCNIMIEYPIVKCSNCLVRTDGCATKEDAAEEWNTRNSKELRDVYSCSTCLHFSSGNANFDAGGICLKHDQTCYADDGICINFVK